MLAEDIKNFIMKFYRNILFVSFFVVSFFLVAAGQGIAIGQWRTHLPYNKIIAVAYNENQVFAATPYAVIIYDKTNSEIFLLTKVNGLKDTRISTIAWHPWTKQLLIAYESGYVDFYNNGHFQGMNDIARTHTIQGSKRINAIHLTKNLIYFLCDFGVVVYNINKKEVAETWLIGPNGSQLKVFDMEFFRDTIYLATSRGLFYAPQNSLNLADFNFWRVDSFSIKQGYIVNIIETFNNHLIVNFTKNQWDTDTTYKRTIGGEWILLPQLEFSLKRAMKRHNNFLAIARAGSVIIIDTTFQIAENIWYFDDYFLMPNDFVIDKYLQKTIWIADDKLGLIKNYNVWSNEFILVNGPYTNSVYYLFANKNGILGVPGSLDVSWNNMWQNGGFYFFENERWNNVNADVDPRFMSIPDIVTCIVDPINNHKFYLGSYGSGLIQANFSGIEAIYNSANSPLGHVSNYTDNVRVSALNFDYNNYLWIVTSGTNRCITVKTPQNTWYNYAISEASSFDVFNQIVIDEYNTKWVASPKGGGILIFNENGTFNNTSDDISKRLNTSIGNGALPSMNVRALAVDKDGKVWVGTDKGIVVFYYPQNVLTSANYDAQQILVEVGGYVQPLLESEQVNCIVVDGANRKWIGTEKAGVFLLTPDGTKEILHFTAENSPLLSNSVKTIAIHPSTGEVFFGTYQGIISYKGTATEPPSTYDDSILVYAYPNPVKSGYNGYIAIKNLVYNSYVKITDAAGNLIYQTQAHGGQAVWDGLLPDGSRPASGVFLVFAVDETGKEKMVTKILFIK